MPRMGGYIIQIVENGGAVGRVVVELHHLLISWVWRWVIHLEAFAYISLQRVKRLCLP